MINYQLIELFNQSSIRKDIDMVYDTDSHITNKDVVSGSFSLNESAFATKELRFGSLVSSQLTVKLYNTVPNLMDKQLDVSIVVDNATSNPLKIGKFKVLEDKPTTDRLYKQIKAYDALYEVINKNMVEWYESLTFPMTLKAFRDSFFAYLGITQVSTTLVNDTVQIEKTITANSISGQQVLSAICELNGAIGRMNRDGDFEYVILEVNPTNRITIDQIVSKSGSYEDFDCQPITKVQIRQTTDDIGTIVGENGNTYIVQDNFLVYGKSSADLITIATRLLSIIEGITYTPFNIKAIYGNPCYEIGDAITVVTKNKTFNSYIFNRTLKGIQAMSDTIKADGVEYYTENLNSVNVQVQQLKRQTNELSRTVEETKSTITSVEALANNATDLANEANKNANQALDNIDISATAEGNPITVTDSGNQPFIEFKEDGYIEQKTLSGKNKLPWSGLVTTTKNGVTFTPVYEDGLLQYINVNGTATDTATFGASDITLDNGSYILNGCTGGSTSTYTLTVRTSKNGTNTWYNNSTSERAFTISDTETFGSCYIQAASGVTVSNVKIYPMIRLATETDSTYEPYCGGTESPNPEFPQRIDGLGDKGYFDGKLRQGYYYPNTGIVNNANMVVSNNYIPCNENDVIELIYEETIVRADYDVFSIVFFDSDKTYISQVASGSSAKTFSATAPTNAKYFLFDIRQDTALTPTTAKHISVTINGNYAIPVKTTNKNIFGGLALANALVNSGSTNVVLDEENGTVQFGHNTNYADTVNRVLFDKFKENTQYTFVLKGKAVTVASNSQANNNITVKYTDGTRTYFVLYNASDGDDINLVVTSEEGKTIDYIDYGYRYTDVNILYYNECGVFEGVITEDEFETYEETVATIPIDAPLYEGDYIERFADGTGQIVRKYNVVVFDGSSDETWGSARNGALHYTYFPRNQQAEALLSPNIKCSHYMTTTRYWTAAPNLSCGMMVDNTRQFGIIDESITVKEDWLAWLQSNPITVVYELAEPIITPLTAEQLAEIEKLYTFEPITNVFAESNTYIRYYKDNQNADVVAQGNHNVLAKAQSSITQTADEIKLEVSKTYSTKAETTNLDNRLKTAESSITQNTEKIELKVSKGDVSSQLSVENEQITIKGNRLVVDADNFSLSADGQWRVGDEEQYIEFFENESGNKQLVINAQGVSVDENGSATLNGTVYAHDSVVIGKVPEGNYGYIPPSGFTSSTALSVDTSTIIKKYYGSLTSNYATGGTKTGNLIANGIQGEVGEFTDTLFGNKVYGNNIETISGANLDELNDSFEFSTVTKVRFAVNPTDGTLRIRLYVDDTNYFDLYATSNTFRFYKTENGTQSEVWKITP